MPKQGQQYFAYLLRAWREHKDAGWRFSLEGAFQEKQIHFTDFADLVTYLAGLVHDTRFQKKTLSKKEDHTESN